MPEQVWYQTKLTQSGLFLVRYWTKIYAGMPMPALVSSMPALVSSILMPSYGLKYKELRSFVSLRLSFKVPEI
jgi:hypothetical protein